MNRRIVGVLLSTLSTLALVLGVAWWLTRPASPPNVVLILIDTLRADRLGCYGHSKETSPTIDALAERGILFEQAFSQAGWTKPAVPSLLTGKYPIQHGVFSNRSVGKDRRLHTDVLGRDHETLAEALQKLGYQTGAFINNPHIRSFLGFDQGFDTFEEELGDAADIRSRFQSWHSRLAADAPFFAYVHFLDPHLPYDPPASYRDRFVPEAFRDFDTRSWRRMQSRSGEADSPPPPETIEAMLALYDAEIRYTDDEIGRIVEALEESGQFENTWVIVVADHGEEFFEHGHLGHNRSLYDELLHIPMVVAGPGIREGRISTPVELIDIFPTVVEAAGGQSPDTVAGRSLGPAFSGQSLPDRPGFADHRSEDGIWQSVRDQGHKLIRFTPATADSAGPTPADPRGSPTATKPRRLESSSAQVFDLENDPHESNDLSDTIDAERRAHLEQLLDDWALAYTTHSGSDPVVVDEATMERLRSLGYIK